MLCVPGAIDVKPLDPFIIDQILSRYLDARKRLMAPGKDKFKNMMSTLVEEQEDEAMRSLSHRSSHVRVYSHAL